MLPCYGYSTLPSNEDYIFPARNSRCGKVMFSQGRVKNSVHGGGGCLPHCTEGYTPLRQTPPGKSPPGRHPLDRHPLPEMATAADGTHPTDTFYHLSDFSPSLFNFNSSVVFIALKSIAPLVVDNNILHCATVFITDMTRSNFRNFFSRRFFWKTNVLWKITMVFCRILLPQQFCN